MQLPVTTLLIRNRKAQRKNTVQRMWFNGNVAAINSNTIWQVFCEVFNNQLYMYSIVQYIQLLGFSNNVNIKGTQAERILSHIEHTGD